MDIDQSYYTDQDHFMAMAIDDDFPPNSSPSRSSDYVKWQASQTSCVALDNLIMEASNSKKESRRPSRHATSSSALDTSSILTGLSGPSPIASTSAFTSTHGTFIFNPESSSHQRARPRPRPRPRIDLASAPLQKDASMLFDLLKGVSERVDGKIIARSNVSSEAKGCSAIGGGVARVQSHKGKGKTIERGVKENAKGRQALALSSSMLGAKNRDASNRGPITGHRSLPNLDVNIDIESVMDVDDDIYCPIEPGPPSNRPLTPQPMPPPPIPKKPSSTSSAAPAPKPKYYPLIQSRSQERKESPIPPAPHPTPLPLQPPVTTVTTRVAPPPLGMRRTANRSSASSASPFIPSQGFPAKQKGFKPPLLSQLPPPSTSTSTNVDTKNINAFTIPDRPKQAHTLPTPDLTPSPVSVPAAGAGKYISRESPPPSPTEADSSFGDMSFDMDALEETMRKYD